MLRARNATRADVPALATALAAPCRSDRIGRWISVSTRRDPRAGDEP